MTRLPALYVFRLGIELERLLRTSKMPVDGINGINGTHDGEFLDMVVLELNSGTAMDGIDEALCHLK